MGWCGMAADLPEAPTCEFGRIDCGIAGTPWSQDLLVTFLLLGPVVILTVWTGVRMLKWGLDRLRGEREENQ